MGGGQPNPPSINTGNSTGDNIDTGNTSSGDNTGNTGNTSGDNTGGDNNTGSSSGNEGTTGGDNTSSGDNKEPESPSGLYILNIGSSWTVPEGVTRVGLQVGSVYAKIGAVTSGTAIIATMKYVNKKYQLQVTNNYTTFYINSYSSGMEPKNVTLWYGAQLDAIEILFPK